MASERRTRRPRRPAAKEIEAKAAETEGVTLYGKFATGLTQVMTSNLALVALPGHLEDGSETLVPVIDLQLLGFPDQTDGEGGDDEVGKVLTSLLLPLENLAFLLQDMCFDLRRATGQLVQLGAGGLSPPPSRIEYSISMLNAAMRHLNAGAENLSQLGQAPASTRAPAASAEDGSTLADAA